MLSSLINTAEQRTLLLNQIRRDGGTQPREGIDWEHVKDMQQALADGAALPPVSVIYDGAAYWLWDGYHRWHAYNHSGRLDIPVVIQQGTQDDAQWQSLSANQAHGLKRTPDDKERAIRAALKHPKSAGMSNSAIARHLGVSDKTVAKYREEMEASSEIPKIDTRVVERNGQVYTQNTANIGANRPDRLNDGDLTTIVQTWMAGFWRRPWPENPSHTNGTLWQELTAWLHENVRQTWQEGQLKEVIKRLHYAHVEQWKTPAAAAPSRTEIYEIETVVRSVVEEESATAADLRTIALLRIGRVWLECRKKLPADVPYRDLAQAINNVADQMVSRQHAPVPTTTIAPTVAYVVPAVDGDLPLPAWAADDSPAAPVGHVSNVTEPATQAAPPNLPLPAWAADPAAPQATVGHVSNVTEPATQAAPPAGKLLVDYTDADWAAAAAAEKQRIAAAVAVAAPAADPGEDAPRPSPLAPDPTEPTPVSQRADYESDEWYTPAEYIEAARTVMGAIDLDPASSEMAQTVVRANVYLTRFDDGLRQARWIHQRIWLNPPYSNPAPWIEKLVREHQAGPYCTEAIVLVNNATETTWFQLLLERYPVCLPARRIAFWRHDHANVGARQGQAFFYLGPNAGRFQEIFSQFGPILRRLS